MRDSSMPARSVWHVSNFQILQTGTHVRRFDTILVANRGEIAVRIMRTAHELGYRTVAVYSEVDRGMPHTLLADTAVCIGPAPATQSYLDFERVLDAACRTGAGAIHPGYGFLSENEVFAKACGASGVTFIGPRPEAIRLMGDKAVAKRIMIEAAVPCIPGYDGEDQHFEVLMREGERIGYPVMVKAVAGGGGKGIRLVEHPAHLADAIHLARSEAEKSFGNGQLMLEKAVRAPRHVEVQVFGDEHGSVVYVGDRDCSIQRRHQKVIEEAPAPGIDDSVRAAMGEAAVRAARAVAYVGAGTVEFLVEAGGAFYFLEMNTRLQVEHPVTEMVTGLDLVEWQIRVAQGEPLPLPQHEIAVKGHAIEARLYAEDPGAGFLPQSGRIEHWLPPAGLGIRVDHGLQQGASISTWYDPMIAKVIAAGKDREEARRRLVRALQDQVVVGLPTNRSLLLRCLANSGFIEGRLSTDFIEHNIPPIEGMSPPANETVALAAVLLWSRAAASQARSLRGWRSSGWTEQPLALRCGDWKSIVRIFPVGAGFKVQFADYSHIDVEMIFERPGWGRATLDGIDRNFQINWSSDELEIAVDGLPYAFSTWLKEGTGNDDARPTVRAPMPGTVRSVRVKLGDAVTRGDVLLTMEAMKMETTITAPCTGKVIALHCSTDQQVPLRHLLAEIEPAA
jgi:geranyl-CoA carboxylase alpha subunit